MRADARKNRDHLLAVARAVVAEQGADASLRDIARRADVGLPTLYRHFPTREALLEALLRASFDELAAQAAELESSTLPEDALITWLRDCVTCAREVRGLTTLMMAAIEDTESALHASCATMRAAGTRLLECAQAAGTARTDIDGTDLFALVGALAWLGDQPSLTPRADHLFAVVASAILTSQADRGVREVGGELVIELIAASLAVRPAGSSAHEKTRRTSWWVIFKERGHRVLTWNLRQAEAS